MKDHPELREQLVALLPRLRRFAIALAGQREAGEDLLQAGVERALARADAFEEGRRLDSWMFKIMHNLWIDSRRRSGREVQVDPSALDAMGEDGRVTVEARDDLRAVREAFAALPLEQRAVMALIVLEGYSYAEAAEALDTPIGTIMSRLSRARATLTGSLQRTGIVTPFRKKRDAQ
jgi:RNA polymerase sigma-70 factor (ECF subfamily)